MTLAAASFHFRFALMLGVSLGALVGSGLASRASAAPIVQTFERFHATPAAAASAEGGLLLLNELNCVGCHVAPEAWRNILPGRAPLSLRSVGTRLSISDLREFIGTPHVVKPGTTMPVIGAAREPENLAALAQFLSSLRANPKSGVPAVSPASDGDRIAGRDLFHRIGCVACHEPETSSVTAATTASVPLALAGRYPVGELARFLADPLATRPSGRMPAFPLTEPEARDLAAYLSHRYAPASPTSTAPAAAATPSRATEGQHVFATLRCQSCHDTGRDLPRATATALANLSTEGRGCLSPRPEPDLPDFGLSEIHRSALRKALAAVQQNAPPAPQAHEQVHRFMQQLNCYACHARNGKGGVEPARAAFFTTSNDAAHSLGDFGTLPPALNVTGRKLTPEWWTRLLSGQGGAVRPYLSARMPAIGQASAELIYPTWAEADRREPPVTIDVSGRQLHQRAHYGRILLGTGEGGMGCINCHGLKGEKSLGVPAIDLTFTTARLQPAYFKELLLNPQALQPGTLMPPMFLGRAKADQEIEQLWTYLREIDQQRLPDGLLRQGEFELRPETAGRPLVLRTFLEGAGFQAIAVGFPVRVHVAFDAAEVRWALTWRGRFLDAMSTWEERAMTPAVPLGEAVKQLPLHLPFARLSSAQDPWPDTFGPASGYRYKGMSVDQLGVPHFHYSVGDLVVSDTLVPSSDGRALHRTLKLEGGRSGWYFRGLAGGAPVPVTFDAAGRAELQEAFTW